MTVTQLEVLVEELSAERALTALLPRIVPDVPLAIRTFRGKPDLLKKLPGRLAGYSTYASASGLGVVVLADRDAEDCAELKERLEKLARAVGLITLTTSTPGNPAIVANRIAVEELEAWFFGGCSSVPGCSSQSGREGWLPRSRQYRRGDSRSFEKVLQEHGHHRAGLNRVQAASSVAVHMDVENNRSSSFAMFRDGVRRLVGGDH